jgi:hypothetical protein
VVFFSAWKLLQNAVFQPLASIFGGSIPHFQTDPDIISYHRRSDVYPNLIPILRTRFPAHKKGSGHLLLFHFLLLHNQLLELSSLGSGKLGGFWNHGLVLLGNSNPQANRKLEFISIYH